MLSQLTGLLLAAVIEVTTHGAVADDATSDSAAFRSAFAAASAGDTVHAGCGVWDLPKIDNLSAVYLNGLNGITFDGDGTCTSLKMAGGTHVGDYHIFYVVGGSNWTFKDFACNGNRVNIVDADEQTHCLTINGVAGFTAHDLTLSHAWGDGIKFIGDSTTMTDVWAYDIIMDDNGRSGLAFAGCGNCLVERITATNISDSGIDTEPPLPGMIVGFIVRDTYIGPPTSYGAAAFSLSNGNNFEVYNTTIDGGVHCSGSDSILLDHVIIRAAGLGGGITALSMNGIDDVVMNRVNIEASGVYSGITTASVLDSSKPTNWVLSNVKVTVDSGRAFSLDGGGPGVMTLNKIHVRSSHPSRYAGTGLYASSTIAAPPMTGLLFQDIDITGVQYGIILAQGFGKATMAVTATGNINLDHVSGFGTFCDHNGGLTFNQSGLVIDANTVTSGCP